MTTKTKTMRKVMSIIGNRPTAVLKYEESSPAPLLHKRTRELSSSTWGNSLQANDNISSCSCVNFSAKKAKKLVTVLVGPEKRLFKVPPHFLDHMLIQGLLEKSLSAKEVDTDFDEKENEHLALMRRTKPSFPRDFKGLIHLDCDAILFEHILWLVKKDDPSLRQLNIDELMEFYT